MNNITFSTSSFICMAVEILLVTVLAVAIWMIWHKKTNEKITLSLAGAGTWFVFAIVLKNIFQVPILMMDSVKNNIVLTLLIGSVFAGVFEESGRFVTFRTVMKKCINKRNSVTYGIGHGGFEALYIVIPTLIIYMVMGAAINNGTIDSMTASFDEATKATMMSQLESAAQINALSVGLAVLERVSAVTFHICMSVLVFEAARNSKYIMLYPLAVVMHFAFDASTVLLQTGKVSIVTFEIILAVLAAVTAVFTYRFYNSLPQEVLDNERCLECDGRPDKTGDTYTASEA